MNDSKPWWASTTIWGAMISAVCAILSAAHINISSETQAQAVNAIIGLVGAVGAIVAIIGRVKASKQIGGKDGYSICFVPIALAACLFIAGCQNSTQSSTQPTPAPGSKAAYVQAEKGLKAADQTLTNFRQHGFIETATWQGQVLPAINAAGRALDDWRAVLGQPGAAQAQTVFESAMLNVLTGLADAQAKQNAATKPTN